MLYFFSVLHLHPSSQIWCLNPGSRGRCTGRGEKSKAESPAFSAAGFCGGVFGIPLLCNVLSHQQREAGPCLGAALLGKGRIYWDV